MKNLSILVLFLATLVSASANTAPRPKVPIMGWASWNNYRINISETIIKSQADAMVSSGMQAAGYQFINIDDGFFGGRDGSGELQVHPTKFPNGMKAVADYIHSKGLKAGIYSEAGTNTCGFYYDSDAFGEGSGLLGHEVADLTTMLQVWGYDFIKIDWCGGLREGLDEKTRYTEIGKVIRMIKPEAVYNICRWQYPGDWGKYTADSWRVSGDIEATFNSVMHIVDICEPLWMHCSPGHFNDMDMLQVGRGMSVDEDKAHFTMWCMMNSPLLAGNDLSTMSQQTVDILTNPEIIALNQDPLCYQARRLRDDGSRELWAKPMGTRDSGDVAVTLLNRGSSNQTISFNLSEIGIDAAAGYSVRDLWQRQDVTAATTATTQSFTVPAHGVIVLRINGTAVGNHPFSEAPGWSYAAWSADTGLTAANDDMADDPDGDGISNLMEFALDGLHPLHPNSNSPLSVAVENGKFVSRYSPRKVSDATLTPYFQYGGLDANGWSEVMHGQGGLEWTIDALGHQVSADLQASAEDKFFLRLVAEYTPAVINEPNLSFEFPALSSGTYSFSNALNWSFTGHSFGVENVSSPTRYGSSGFGTTPAKLDGQGGNGDQVGYINLSGAGDTGSATSAILATIEPDTTYVLTIAFGQRSTGVQLPISRFGLMSSSTELGTFTDVPGRSLGTGFHDFTYQWTSPPAGDPLIGQPLRVSMEFTYDAVLGGAQQAQFDNVRLTTGVFGPIAITNGSFENDPIASGVPDGWTQTAGDSSIGVGQGGSHGSQYIWMGPGVAITQDLGHTLTAGEKLTLKYDSSRGTGYARRIQLLAKNGGGYQVIAQTEERGGDSTWPTLQLEHIVESQYAGQQLALRVMNIDYDSWCEFDNFRLTVGEQPEGYIEGWDLVWRDEFNGQEIDWSTWSKVTRGSPDWRNTMTTDPKVFGIGDGRLHLKGMVNDDQSSDPAPFLTGGLTSKDKYSFQHGKIVIRARFDSARGAWPALWMLGNQGGWPSNGEIDLMEHISYENRVHQSVHSTHTYSGINNPTKTQSTWINRNGYNTYGCEWDAWNIHFTVNGTRTLTYPRWPVHGAAQWPFNQPFYIILSMQIGGNWPGAGDPSDGNYPIDMEVDWIRVYKPN